MELGSPDNVDSSDIFDLTVINTLTFQQRDGNRWKVPNSDYDEVLDCLQSLWERVDDGTVFWFYCKKGVHRSYAGCIMFLMFVTKIFDWRVFANLIASQRANVRLLRWEETHRGIVPVVQMLFRSGLPT